MKIKLLVVFLLALIFASCEFDDSDLRYNMGNDFISDPTNVFMIDTLSIYTYTTAIDSFATSRTNRFLSGRVESEYGVKTYCESYFTFEASDYASFHSTAQYDSVCMILNLDGYNYGDTTMAGEFEIYKLTESITVDESNYYIYNTTQFEAETTPFATFSVDYSTDEKEIQIKLADNFGEELYNMVYDESELLFDVDLFEEYFKGIVIRPAESNQSFIAGFEATPDSSSAPRIRVYYHDITTTDDLYLDFPIEKFESISASSTSEFLNYRAFNYIFNDYSESVLSEVETGEAKLASTATDNVSFIQAGSMLRTRIEIPTIDHLVDFGIGSIIKAELYMEPVKGTYTEEEDLPSVLQMSLVDDRNRYYDMLYSTGTEENAYGVLNFNKEFQSKTNFTYDITNYVKTEYESIADPLYSLMMVMPFNSKYPDLRPLVIGNSMNTDHKMKLKVYLTNY
ncbi:MAG: hypothetical protein PF541_16410 [Prolixibacteraceae bacterium]|jgi:hypothetical protein|nr:hypothetical protein [Prolixibacteraceae bacterium]